MQRKNFPTKGLKTFLKKLYIVNVGHCRIFHQDSDLNIQLGPKRFTFNLAISKVTMLMEIPGHIWCLKHFSWTEKQSSCGFAGFFQIHMFGPVSSTMICYDIRLAKTLTSLPMFLVMKEHVSRKQCDQSAFNSFRAIELVAQTFFSSDFLIEGFPNSLSLEITCIFVIKAL